jgi:hypothetical protein
VNRGVRLPHVARYRLTSGGDLGSTYGMRSIKTMLVTCVLGAMVACGSSGPGPVEACNNVANATCSRIYACFTAAELAAANYPTTESACDTMLQASQGCSAKTVQNACTGNETYHADQVDPCVSQLHGLTCAQVRDPNFGTNVNTQAPACGKVCAI